MINVSKVNWNLKNTILWFLSRFETIYHMYQASEHASQPHNLRYSREKKLKILTFRNHIFESFVGCVVSGLEFRTSEAAVNTL